MEFHEMLNGYSAKDLQVVFPGIPLSTCYDWLSGNRVPLVYLRGCILGELERSGRRALEVGGSGADFPVE